MGILLDMYSHGKDAVNAFSDGNYTKGLTSLLKVGLDGVFTMTKLNPYFLAGQAAYAIYNAYEDANGLGLLDNR